MENVIKVLTSKRFMSFYWRTGMMIFAGFITLIANSVGDFGITGQYAVLFGLILGEVSKSLNNTIKNK